jgi:hypothetical protein
MKNKFYYVESINLYINLNLLLSFQLVERTFMNFEKGKMDKRMECCLSIGTNAFFCEEFHFNVLTNILTK